MRFLLGRTDALGDLVVSLPVMERILRRMPEAEIHWLVRPYAAPLLEGQPGIAGVHARKEDQDLVAMIRSIRPDAVLNLGHRDTAIIVATKEAGVPIRVARARKLPQILAATHRLWRGRYGTGRHESENLLDFLYPWGWDGGVPPSPRLFVPTDEEDAALSELLQQPGEGPILGLVLQGSGAGAHPSKAWWDKAIPVLANAGWRPVVLSPSEDSPLPERSLTGLMARLSACHAVLGPSTGPVHVAAALGKGVLCLMGRRPNHTPDRWAPLGKVQVVQYDGPEDDLGTGMDRLDPETLIPHLARLAPDNAVRHPA
jgi:heptosyltransferase-3